MESLSLRRLVYISSITVVVVLLVAGVAWLAWRHLSRERAVGAGTKIVSAALLKDAAYRMPGGAPRASTPLSDLLPTHWRATGCRIVVEKSTRLLSVYVGRSRVKSYFMALGYHPAGAKERRDDGRTPEGVYYVCWRNPGSAFGLSVQISYPGAREAEEGFRRGLIDRKIRDRIVGAITRRRTPPQDTALGGGIFIHGGGVGEVADDFSRARILDWTLGCIALRDEDIAEIFDFAEPGTTVTIRP